MSCNDFAIDVSFYALCALMFFVGISVGSDIDTLKGLRGLDMRLLFLPLFTIAGTLIACFLLSMLLPQRSPSDCMAVGAGFGYYSLSSIFITEYRGPELGTVALLSNIAREIITLLGAPLLLKYFGRLDFRRRRDNNGHHTPDNNTDIRQSLRYTLNLPRLRRRLLRSPPRHPLLLSLRATYNG